MGETDKLSDRIAALDLERRRLLELRLRERSLHRPDGEAAAGPTQDVAPPSRPPAAAPERPGETSRAEDGSRAPMAFSLFFFSADGSKTAGEKYRLLLESARFADSHGFDAIWIPERHFDPFGGLYPSPSVLAAALAIATERIRIRAGSVVLPLHDPVRVAEEWSVIDNLSRGRVGVSFASGWHPDDFVLAPASWNDRKDLMFGAIETVKRLWAGERVALRGGTGAEVHVRVYPMPLQRELPVWITSAGNPETWVRAAQIGANVLTALLEQSIEETGEKIALYRRTLAEHGHDPGTKRVTMMLHTFVGEDVEQVRETVREPMSTYLRSHIGLYEKLARGGDVKLDVDSVTEADKEVLVAFAFDRYFKTNALFGSVATCSAMIDRLRSIGVDEVASLIDFGVDDGVALDGLTHLNLLRERYAGLVTAAGA